MLSTASPHPSLLEPTTAISPGLPGQPSTNNASAASLLSPLSAAAYLEMATRALNLPNNQQQNEAATLGANPYASALAAAALQQQQQQERQHQLFSAMCGAVMNQNQLPPNPLAAMLASNPAAAALMAPHLMAACFREEPKPPHSYIGLIAMAILSSPEKKMVLSDIYQWILDHYPYFRSRGPGWRNSIRHNLSLNDCFVKVGRSANGKGHFWAIHPANLSDFQRGDFRRKKAQKRIKKHMGIIDNDEDDDDECMMGGGGLDQHSDEDCDNKGSPLMSKSSLSMSPAERFSEFLLMKSGGGGQAISGLEDADRVAMAARLAMRLQQQQQQQPQPNYPPHFASLAMLNVAGQHQQMPQPPAAASSSQSSNSPVEVVSDDETATTPGPTAGTHQPSDLAKLLPFIQQQQQQQPQQLQNNQLQALNLQLTQHLARLMAASAAAANSTGASCSPNNSNASPTMANFSDLEAASGAKKRRIFDIESLLASSS